MEKIISLEALNHNLRAVKTLLNSNTELMAIVKKDAYGHGASVIVPELQSKGVRYFGVATLEEAMALRDQGIYQNIVILSSFFEENIESLFEYRLTPTVSTLRMAHQLVHEAKRLQQPLTLHLKVDTGMSRCGLFPEELEAAIAILGECDFLTIEGLYSHWATADEFASMYAQRQEDQLLACLKICREKGLNLRFVHMANSSGLLVRNLKNFNMVRIGILLYGQVPDRSLRGRLSLTPVMHWRARVVQTKILAPGIGVSYGCQYQTTTETPVAIVNAGYGDGFPQALSGQGKVLINGQKRPIIGTVCMDFVIVQLESSDKVSVGEEVCLLGQQGSAMIDALEMATQAGSIPYEILCRGAQMRTVELEEIILNKNGGALR
jgi:alanine racemase